MAFSHRWGQRQPTCQRLTIPYLWQSASTKCEREPYMWAAKSHYYSPSRSFYNFPYMFGLLFGLGLYARYTADPEGFKAGYDELLASTGLADAATLAARFDIDIRTPAFWRASLDIIRADIAQFEQLVGS